MAVKQRFEGEFLRFGKKIGYELILVEKSLITNEAVREKCKVDKSNYGKNYACPPFAPKISQFPHKNILVYLFYVYGKSLDNWEILAKLTYDYGRRLEKELDGICFIAGQCRLCEKCKAEEGKPCIHPEEMRYSFTAVGLDSEKLNNFLKQKIVWNSEHIYAVAGCLTNHEKLDLKRLASIITNL